MNHAVFYPQKAVEDLLDLSGKPEPRTWKRVHAAASISSDRATTLLFESITSLQAVSLFPTALVLAWIELYVCAQNSSASAHSTFITEMDSWTNMFLRILALLRKVSIRVASVLLSCEPLHCLHPHRTSEMCSALKPWEQVMRNDTESQSDRKVATGQTRLALLLTSFCSALPGAHHQLSGSLLFLFYCQHLRLADLDVEYYMLPLIPSQKTGAEQFKVVYDGLASGGFTMKFLWIQVWFFLW